MTDTTTLTHTDSKKRFSIGTVNPNITNPEEQSIEFFVNPASVSVNPELITRLKKTQNGYIKEYYGEGLVSISLGGKIPLYWIDPVTKQKTFGGQPISQSNGSILYDITRTDGWKWADRISKFIRKNAPYLFYLDCSEFINLNDNGGLASGGDVIAPYSMLIGDIKLPTTSRDADNPYILNFNFTFQGTPVQGKSTNKKIEERTSPNTQNYTSNFIV